VLCSSSSSTSCSSWPCSNRCVKLLAGWLLLVGHVRSLRSRATGRRYGFGGRTGAAQRRRTAPGAALRRFVLRQDRLMQCCHAAAMSSPRSAPLAVAEPAAVREDHPGPSGVGSVLRVVPCAGPQLASRPGRPPGIAATTPGRIASGHRQTVDRDLDAARRAISRARAVNVATERRGPHPHVALVDTHHDLPRHDVDQPGSGEGVRRAHHRGPIRFASASTIG